MVIRAFDGGAAESWARGVFSLCWKVIGEGRVECSGYGNNCVVNGYHL